MSAEPSPVFVERRTYRRRRLVDAARLLPVLGVALICLPLLWISEGGPKTSTTYAMIYFFGLWVALTVVTGLLSKYLNEDDAPQPEDDNGRGPSGEG